MLNKVKIEKYFPANLHIINHAIIFAQVFHGIRFKVRRLFVVTTSNFFLLYPYFHIHIPHTHNNKAHINIAVHTEYQRIKHEFTRQYAINVQS